jgi:hypothetical protein
VVALAACGSLRMRGRDGVEHPASARGAADAPAAADPSGGVEQADFFEMELEELLRCKIGAPPRERARG